MAPLTLCCCWRALCPALRGQVYVENPEFKPDKIKTVSNAAYGLCSWVCAMEAYDRVVKVSRL